MAMQIHQKIILYSGLYIYVSHSFRKQFIVCPVKQPKQTMEMEIMEESNGGNSSLIHMKAWDIYILTQRSVAQIITH